MMQNTAEACRNTLADDHCEDLQWWGAFAVMLSILMCLTFTLLSHAASAATRLVENQGMYTAQATC